MATIQSLGIGSGLDVNSIITKLVDLEKQPLTVLQAKANLVQAKISSFGQIQSQFSALNDAVSGMTSPSAWSARSTSSSNNGAATLSATTTAQATSFSLDVDALAQVQSVSSNTLTAGSAVGAGTLTFRLGSWASGGTSFIPTAGSADVQVTVSVTDKVSDIAAKINAANAGVTATAFNDGTNDRLLVRSNTTGVASGFRIQATDADTTNTDDAGLSRLAFDPATLNPATSATFGMAGAGVPVQFGQDAKARINGLAVTSSSNTLSNNIPGVTINLQATTTTGYGTAGEVKAPIAMTVSNDTSLSVKNVQNLVTAYNTLSQTLSSMTAYNASTKTAGPFQGDSVIVGLQSALRNMLGSVSNTGGVYQRLSDVGIAFQRDGTLSIDSVKLGAAANNGNALQQLFTTNTNNPLTNGFAVKFAAFAQGAMSSFGMLSNEAGALQKQLSSNSKDQDKVNQHVATVQAQLQKQYSALDAKMGSLSALSAYVTQQVTLWNKSTA